MTDHAKDYRAEISATRYLGLRGRSRGYKAQLFRVFGELVGEITPTLLDWRILDIGCGDGRWLRTVLEFDAKPEDLVGVDVSDARFEIGRAKNPLVTLMQTNGTTIPFPDGRFDCQHRRKRGPISPV